MSAQLVLLALSVGAIAGAAITSLIIWALRQRQMDDEQTSDVLPRGVAQLVAQLDGAVMILDRSLNVVVASESAQHLGLISNRRLIDSHLNKLANKATKGKVKSKENFEITRGALGSGTLLISASASPLRKRFVLLTVTDRGEYQRLDNVRREFIANISHELKTPISSVSLLAEALQEGAEDPEMVRHFANRLTEESQRLGDITKEIIELSRIQGEGALAEFAPVTVSDVVEKAIDNNRVVAKSKHISLATGGTLDAIVSGDFDRLVVALSNLVANAVHYSPENSQVGIGVTIRDEYVEIAVTDQGIGMTKEEAERVFERFYRTDQARSRSTGGTGLGLSIVKHIISNHGGDVRVWSAPGKGSTFTLRLPEAVNPGKELLT